METVTLLCLMYIQHTCINVYTHTTTTTTTGAEVEVYVTTSLSADGSFWVQLSLEDSCYDTLVEQMKERLSVAKEVMTPVFFNVGDLCAAMYSEDESWYRARVIAVCDSRVSTSCPLRVHCDLCVCVWRMFERKLHIILGKSQDILSWIIFYMTVGFRLRVSLVEQIHNICTL